MNYHNYNHKVELQLKKFGKKFKNIIFVTGLMLSTISCGQNVFLYTPEVINTYPHDSNAFTQGLLFHNDKLYESTGQQGRSTLREVDIETGKVLRYISLADEFFAEGLALVNNQLIQLTWQGNRAFVYDLNTFQQEKRFSYRGQGWGLCFDGASFFMSDGSSIIKKRDPENFEVIGRINVTLNGEIVQKLNELECVNNYIYANVWQTNTIVKINKNSGKVVAEIDASNLLSLLENKPSDVDAVLNGIAYNTKSNTFYLTGKLWSKLFEVRFNKK